EYGSRCFGRGFVFCGLRHAGNASFALTKPPHPAASRPPSPARGEGTPSQRGIPSPLRGRGVGVRGHYPFQLHARLFALTRRDVVLFRVLLAIGLNQRVDDRAVAVVIASDELPFPRCGIPLLDRAARRALVVRAGDLYRLDNPLEAELLQPRRSNVEG